MRTNVKKKLGRNLIRELRELKENKIPRKTSAERNAPITAAPVEMALRCAFTLALAARKPTVCNQRRQDPLRNLSQGLHDRVDRGGDVRILFSQGIDFSDRMQHCRMMLAPEVLADLRQ